MTANQLSAIVGATVAVKEKGFAWFAEIIDAKEAYGTVRYLVTPVAGIGTVWVDSGRTTS